MCAYHHASFFQAVPLFSCVYVAFICRALLISILQVNFIQQPLPKGSKTGAGGKHGISGALGRGQSASTGLTTLLQFW